MKQIVFLAVLLSAPFAFSEDRDRDERHGRHAASGIAGEVFLFPHCPVGGFPCPPKPYQGGFSIYDEDGEFIERVVPVEDGFFAVKLKPGNYTIIPDIPSPIQRYPVADPQNVIVNRHEFTEIKIFFRLGI